MTKSLEEIKNHTEFQIESTNVCIESIKSLGMQAPLIMLHTNTQHELILTELKEDNPNLERIEFIINGINKML